MSQQKITLQRFLKIIHLQGINLFLCGYHHLVASDKLNDEKKTKIIIIIEDNMPAPALGCWGNTDANMPNLYRRAAQDMARIGTIPFIAGNHSLGYCNSIA